MWKHQSCSQNISVPGGLSLDHLATLLLLFVLPNLIIFPEISYVGPQRSRSFMPTVSKQKFKPWLLVGLSHRNQHAYFVANVFSGSVATQLRWGGKVCMRLEAMNIRILCDKNYEQWFKLFSQTVHKWHAYDLSALSHFKGIIWHRRPRALDTFQHWAINGL